AGRKRKFPPPPAWSLQHRIPTVNGRTPANQGDRVTMWRLSVRPTEESNLSPVDVVITSQAGGKVADLARGLGTHLGGSDRLLLAPTTGGQPWPADLPLRESGLRDGDLVEVASVRADWLTRPGAARTARAVAHIVAGP